MCAAIIIFCIVCLGIVIYAMGVFVSEIVRRALARRRSMAIRASNKRSGDQRVGGIPADRDNSSDARI